MSWLEVETKVRIHNVDELREKIKKIALFEKKETKEDDYFAIKRKFKKNSYPKKAFRIRNNEEEHVINFKRWLTKHWDKKVVVKEEFEFKIKEVASFLALMKDLGFVQWIKKIKNSESYKYKKDKRISIEINKVKHLGYFMEIEYLCSEHEIEKGKIKIKEILKELKINPKHIDNIGYTKMLWKLKNEKKR